jgi:type IV secretion system protein VirD4
MNAAWWQTIEQGFQWMEAHPTTTTLSLTGLMGTAYALRRRWSAPKTPRDEAYGSASWATVREVRRAGLLDGDGVVLAQLGADPLALLRAGQSHVLGVGPSGIGKSTLLICTLRSWPQDALVLDLTGDLIRETVDYRPGEVYIWEPASLGSLRVNPYDLVRWETPYETLDVQRVATHLTLIEADQTSDIGTYFKDIAELVLTFVPLYLHYRDRTPTPGAPLPVVVSPFSLMRFLRHVPATGLVKLLETMRALPHDTVQLGAQALLDETAARRRDGWNAAARWLNPWLDPVLAQATATALENPRVPAIPVKRLQQGSTPITIYLRLTPEDLQGRLRATTKLILTQIRMWAKDRQAARGYHRELLAAFDDMAEMGYVWLVESMEAFDRKYGIRVCALVQDFNQLWKQYGQYTSLLTNSGVWVVFRPNDPRNAEFLTGKLGEQTRTEPTVRVTQPTLGLWGSRSHGAVSHARPLMTAEEIQKMRPDDILVFAHGLKIRAKAVRYFDHPVFRGAA